MAEQEKEKREYKEKIISLEGNRKLINLCKKNDMYTFNPRGEWNGYGYDKLPMAVKITSLAEMRKFNKLKRELELSTSESKPKTEEERISEWVNRLCKLTGISREEAEEIAEEKLEYKQSQISMLEDRQYERYSVKRQKLINKIDRSNPLRYIKNKDHAMAILDASYRHNTTDYERKLQILHEMEEMGIIEKGEAKEIAKTNTLEEVLELRDEHLKSL